MERVRGVFAFSGRTNRQPYWLTSLALYGVLLVRMLLGFSVPIVGAVVFVVVAVAVMVAGLATAVRRLHDRGRSGWWFLVMYLPLLLLSALGAVARVSEPAVGAFFSLLSLPFSIWVFVDLGCLRGMVGPNRFGPDPLQPEFAAEVFS